MIETPVQDVAANSTAIRWAIGLLAVVLAFLLIYLAIKKKKTKAVD